MDADPRWEKLRKLHEKSLTLDDKLIFEAVSREIEATVAELKEAQAPIPQWALGMPHLLAMFSGANPAPPAPQNPTAPQPSPAPTEAIQASEPEAKEDLSAIERPSPEALAEAENLVRQARLMRTRGNSAEAASLLAQAESKAPGGTSIMEAIGDEMAALGKRSEAKRYYKRAHGLDPKNVSAERKFAELVFSTNVASMTFTSQAESEVVASARSAAILNFLLPGVGQMVLGHYVKGVIFLVVVLGCWIGAVVLGLPKFIASFFGNAPGTYSPAVFVLTPVAIVAHIIAIADAKGHSKDAELRRHMATRPKPPADLPFE